MHSQLKLIITALAAAFVAGCASVGNNFDESQVSQIKKGETTESQLLEMFGAPQNRTVDSEGMTTLTWIYQESAVKGESFIPYAGAFLGGNRSNHKNLNVVLLDGKVQNYNMTGGGMESRGMTQGVPKK